jgi:hypothetical protein
MLNYFRVFAVALLDVRKAQTGQAQLAKTNAEILRAVLDYRVGRL